MPPSDEYKLSEQIKTIICYLWDNYLQIYDPEEIFLMGVGNAYLGVKMLLINRGMSASTLLYLPFHIPFQSLTLEKRFTANEHPRL